MITTTLGISALPWLVFKIPVVGELLHQMRATGYNAKGEVELIMTLPQMKQKQLNLANMNKLGKEESEALFDGKATPRGSLSLARRSSCGASFNTGPAKV